MRITIKATVADDVADPDHELGLTENGYEELLDALDGLGYSDVRIRRTP